MLIQEMPYGPKFNKAFATLSAPFLRSIIANAAHHDASVVETARHHLAARADKKRMRGVRRAVFVGEMERNRYDDTDFL